MILMYISNVCVYVYICLWKKEMLLYASHQMADFVGFLLFFFHLGQYLSINSMSYTKTIQIMTFQLKDKLYEC